jgi:pimeloyl-ACP methyl ester carboxylesterase
MINTNLFLLPGLLNDARLWQYQISGLSDVVRATVADLTGADSISALASSLTIIEECGHLSTLDRPQQVTDALRKWLLNVKP